MLMASSMQFKELKEWHLCMCSFICNIHAWRLEMWCFLYTGKFIYTWAYMPYTHCIRTGPLQKMCCYLRNGNVDPLYGMTVLCWGTLKKMWCFLHTGNISHIYIYLSATVYMACIYCVQWLVSRLSVKWESAVGADQSNRLSYITSLVPLFLLRTFCQWRSWEDDRPGSAGPRNSQCS